MTQHSFPLGRQDAVRPDIYIYVYIYADVPNPHVSISRGPQAEIFSCSTRKGKPRKLSIGGLVDGGIRAHDFKRKNMVVPTTPRDTLLGGGDTRWLLVVLRVCYASHPGSLGIRNKRKPPVYSCDLHFVRHLHAVVLIECRQMYLFCEPKKRYRNN